VAIDGPAGAGKSTLGQALAQALDCAVLDTGLMYRALTREAQEAGIEPIDGGALTDLARRLRFELSNEGPRSELLLNGKVLSPATLHRPEIDRDVSAVSAHPGVRGVVVAQQRELANRSPIVVLGRDIGTVVLPDAGVKLFVTASSEVRAARRMAEAQADAAPVDERELHAELSRRDHIDSSRPVSPLVAASDAIWLDTGNLTVNEAIEAACGAVSHALESVRPSPG